MNRGISPREVTKNLQQSHANDVEVAKLPSNEREYYVVTKSGNTAGVIERVNASQAEIEKAASNALTSSSTGPDVYVDGNRIKNERRKINEITDKADDDWVKTYALDSHADNKTADSVQSNTEDITEETRQQAEDSISKDAFPELNDGASKSSDQRQADDSQSVESADTNQAEADSEDQAEQEHMSVFPELHESDSDDAQQRESDSHSRNI